MNPMEDLVICGSVLTSSNSTAISFFYLLHKELKRKEIHTKIFTKQAILLENLITKHSFKPLKEFQELDHGHDIYATQTILDTKGRRLVVAWFDMWDMNYPEQNDGFNGQITIPRILTLTQDFRLIQRPVPEIRAARTNVIRNGPAAGGANVTLDDKAGEVNIRASVAKDLELYIEGGSTSVQIYYSASSGQISLDRGGNDALRRTEWQPKSVLVLNIFIDASSIEVFCGAGEVTLSSRYFPDGPVSVRLGDNSEVDKLRVINMKRTVPVNSCMGKINDV